MTRWLPALALALGWLALQLTGGPWPLRLTLDLLPRTVPPVAAGGPERTLTARVQAVAGARQLATGLVLAPGETVRAIRWHVTTPFGTSQRLDALALGTPRHEDRLGGLRLTAGGPLPRLLGPWTAQVAQPLVLTAQGGRFDATGTLALTVVVAE